MLISQKCRSLQWLPIGSTRKFADHKVSFSHLHQPRPLPSLQPGYRPLFTADGPHSTAVHCSLEDRNTEESSDIIETTLDDEIGLGDEEDEAFLDADDLDPEGTAFTLDDFYTSREGTPQSLINQLYDQDVFGPPAVVLAGFRVEELAMVRAILDSAGGQDVQVVPANEDLLYEKLSTVIHLPEPDWEKPRPANWTRGGDWGSRRVILFSGMKLAAQAALVELLEESGLPPVCAALAVEEDADKQLGVVLAEAVQAHQARKNPHKNVWEELDRGVKELPDIESILQERVQEIKQDVQKGNWDKVLMAEEPSDEAEEFMLDQLQQHGLAGDEGTPEAAAEPSTTETGLAAGSDEPAAEIQHLEGTDSRGKQPSGSSAASDSALGVSKDLTAELPGASFPDQQNKGQQNRQRGRSDYEELSRSALTDPLTSREGKALRKTLGRAGLDKGDAASDQQDARLGQLREEVSTAGKSFMDSLAQNVGLAADGGVERKAKPGHGRQPELSRGTEDLDDVIDAIATGQDSGSSHESAAMSGQSDAPSIVNNSSSTHNGRSPGSHQPTLKLVTDTKAEEEAAKKIVAELDQKFARLRSESDKDEVTKAMRREAWEPTKDAIKAALDCGIPAEDLMRFIEAEAQQREREKGQWAAAWGDMPTMLPSEEEKAAAAAGNASYDIFSPHPVPRTDMPSQSSMQEQSPATATIAAKGSSGPDADLQEGSSSDARESSREGGAMTKKELRALAERRNLDYAKLLADAEARGIKLEEG